MFLGRSRANAMLDISPVTYDVETRPDQHVSACTTAGNREYQQDAYAIHDDLPLEFFALSTEDREAVLRETISILNAHIVGTYDGKDGGTTLCAAVFWKNEERLDCCVVNIGDSAAYEVIASRDQIELSAERINALHSTDPKKNSLEHERIQICPYLRKKEYRTFTEWRLYLDNSSSLGINFTRSIGDNAHLHYDFFHQPETYVKTYSLTPEENHYFVVASDGLESLDIKEIAQHFRTPDVSLTDRVKALVSSAFLASKGRADNITALILDAKCITSPVLMMVADGHGEKGHFIAQYVTKNFYTTLLDVVRNKPKNDFIQYITNNNEEASLQDWDEKLSILFDISLSWKEKSLDEKFETFASSDVVSDILNTLQASFFAFKERWNACVTELIEIFQHFIADMAAIDSFQPLVVKFLCFIEQLQEMRSNQSAKLKIGYRFLAQHQFVCSLSQEILKFFGQLEIWVSDLHDGLEWSTEAKIPDSLQGSIARFYKLKEESSLKGDTSSVVHQADFY